LSLGCTRRRAAARLALHHHLTLMVPQQNEMPKGGRNAAKIARPTVSASVGDVSSKETSPRDNEASDLTRDCKIFGDSVRRLSVRNLDWRHGNRLTDGPAVVDRSGADSELTGKTVATLDAIAGNDLAAVASRKVARLLDELEAYVGRASNPSRPLSPKARCSGCCTVAWTPNSRCDGHLAERTRCSRSDAAS
jgi:hypothetical protein